MKHTFKPLALTLVLTLSLALVDQVTKGYILYLITGGIPVVGRAFEIVPHAYIMAKVTDFFRIVFTWNPGTSFSLFRELGEAAPMILIVLTGIIIGFFGHSLLFRAKDRLEKWALMLIVGGALGNLIDRIRFGAVIDFLDFHWKTWHWPAFNFADVFITVGVGLYLLHWVLNKRK